MSTKNKVTFYEGSYQFDKIETDLTIIPDNFILYKLQKQYEYRPTTETLWAELTQDGQTTRYEFNPNTPNSLIHK